MSDIDGLRENIKNLREAGYRQWGTRVSELKALVAALDAAEQRERDAVEVLKAVQQYILLVHREMFKATDFNKVVYYAGHETMNKVEAALAALTR
jgi:hypothetical protein